VQGSVIYIVVNDFDAMLILGIVPFISVKKACHGNMAARNLHSQIDRFIGELAS
jgi:hypothetical protein